MRGVLVEPDGIFDNLLGLSLLERFEVGNKIPRCGQVGLCLFVVTANNRIVRALEKAILAILEELY